MPSQVMLSRITSTAPFEDRSTSVSSMRRMNVPFCDFAKAQGYRAERMLPTWMKPVGEGAKRVRTVMGCCSKGVQAARQVGLQVVEMFQAHGHAHQVLADSGDGALLFGQAAVR